MLNDQLDKIARKYNIRGIQVRLAQNARLTEDQFTDYCKAYSSSEEEINETIKLGGKVC